MPIIKSCMRPRFALGAGLWLAAVMAQTACAQANPEPRGNLLNDPFVQATAGIADCPPQPGPMITETEKRAQEHGRVERGTTCYRMGRCRLPNAYLYDAEIIPRVQKAITMDGRFADTSVWAEGQRRWVWLTGCVRSAEQATALEQLVRNLDDVEAVINEVKVWPPASKE